MTTETDRCPCLSGEIFGDCCEPFLTGRSHAPTAERLMRSRYSAFVTGDTDYLLRSWHPRTRPEHVQLDQGVRWFRLDILDRSGGGLLDAQGTVEFSARYRANGIVGEQHEISRFVRENGRWFYLEAL